MKNNILGAMSAKVETLFECVTLENGKCTWTAPTGWTAPEPVGPTLEEVYLDNCKKKGSSASSEVTYVTISKACKMINVALEKDGKAINAPTLKAELSAAGFETFSIKCLDFMWDTHTLLCAPKPGESDFVLIHAHKDSEGRNTYRVQDLVKCFEHKYAYAIKAKKDAKKAENAAKRAAKNAEKADALKTAKATMESILGHTLSDIEVELMAASLGMKKVG